MLTVAAFMIFATWSRPDGSQHIVAIPSSDFGWCERRMESKLNELRASADVHPITIKPYCTTVAPAWWVKAANEQRS